MGAKELPLQLRRQHGIHCIHRPLWRHCLSRNGGPLVVSRGNSSETGNIWWKCHGIYMDNIWNLMGFHGILWDFGFSGNDMDRNWDLVGFRWDLTINHGESDPVTIQSSNMAGKSLNWAFEWIGGAEHLIGNHMMRNKNGFWLRCSFPKNLGCYAMLCYRKLKLLCSGNSWGWEPKDVWVKPEHCSLSTNFFTSKVEWYIFLCVFRLPDPQSLLFYMVLLYSTILEFQVAQFWPVMGKSGLAAMVSSVKWGVFLSSPRCSLQGNHVIPSGKLT